MVCGTCTAVPHRPLRGRGLRPCGRQCHQSFTVRRRAWFGLPPRRTHACTEAGRERRMNACAQRAASAVRGPPASNVLPVPQQDVCSWCIFGVHICPLQTGAYVVYYIFLPGPDRHRGLLAHLPPPPACRPPSVRGARMIGERSKLGKSGSLGWVADLVAD